MSSKNRKQISKRRAKGSAQQVSNEVVSESTLQALNMVRGMENKEKELIQNMLKNLPDPVDSTIEDSYELLGILTTSVPYKNIQLKFKGDKYTKEQYRGLYMRTFIPKIEIFKYLLDLAQEDAHGDSVFIRPYPTILQFGITFWIFESEQFCQELYDKYHSKVDPDVWKMRADGSYEKISRYQDFVEGEENLRKTGFDSGAYAVPDDYEEDD